MTCLFLREEGGWGVRLSFAVTLFWIWYKNCTHRNTAIWKQNIVSLIGICDRHKIRYEKFQEQNVCQLFLSEHTLYTEAKNSRTNKHATANISNFIRMIMAHGWLAPLATVSTFSWKSGTRWWNVLPSLVYIMCTKNSIFIHLEIFRTEKMIGRGGGLVYTSVVPDKATLEKVLVPSLCNYEREKRKKERKKERKKKKTNLTRITCH